MKKLNLLGIIGLLMTFSVLFSSCDDDEGYSLGDVALDYVTVHVLGEGTYSYTGDSWGSMWPAAPVSYPDLRWAEGQRALMYFNPLYDDFSGYDVAIKVLDIQPILTKQVEELTEKNAEEFGDDPAALTNVWLGGGFMNITFQQRLPLSHKHRVSLVKNTTAEYADDGYIHLEFRYNTYGDAPAENPIVDGMVSYNLATLDFKDQKGIQLRINSIKNGEKIIQLDFQSKETAPQNEKLNFEKSKVE